MKVVINSYKLNLQENDEVIINEYPCGDCGSHSEVTVRRGEKVIANFGDAVSIRSHSIEGEIFGGVVLDSNNNQLREYKIHIITKELWKSPRVMTPDKMYYIPLCGTVLNCKDGTENDQITDPRYNGLKYELKNDEIRQVKRVCPECLKIYRDEKNR